MSLAATVDVAGGATGGAARFRDELFSYIARSGRADIQIIGDGQRVSLPWLARREMLLAGNRRIAINNMGFVAPGGERWTLLRNALHFLGDEEEPELDPALRAAYRRKGRMVRMAARRSDMLVAPSAAMAERALRFLPGLRQRMVVRMHPVSPNLIPNLPRDPVILCPVLFASYKHMPERLTELASVIDEFADPDVMMLVTADLSEAPPALAFHRRVEFVGRLSHVDLRKLWARSQTIYFPPGLESFGYPLAEARVSGHRVIARDSEQNREIAGPALCGYVPGDRESLRAATTHALTERVAADPAPFDPDAYFSWLMG